MGCTAAGYKTFLVVCNIGLLFLGFTILSLGAKMKIALQVFSLGKVPLLMNSVKAVVATGFFISVTGGAGFCGSCYEVMWLLLVHLGGLGLIVVMEFSLGVTLMVIKNTVEVALEEADCGEACYSIVTYVVMKLATAAAGTMLTIIILEALMIYSAIQLYYHLRDSPKNPPAPAPVAAGPTVVVQNVQMQNMAAPAPPQPQFVMPAPPLQQPQYAPPQAYAAPPPQQPQYAPPPQAYAAPPPQQPQYAPPPQDYVAPPPQQPQYAPPPQDYVAPPPQQPQYAPPPQAYVAPPPYSQAQPSEQPQPHLEPTVPPLDTSTLTRKPAPKGDV